MGVSGNCDGGHHNKNKGSRSHRLPLLLLWILVSVVSAFPSNALRALQVTNNNETNTTLAADDDADNDNDKNSTNTTNIMTPEKNSTGETEPTETGPSTTEFNDVEVLFTYVVESNSTVLNRGNTEALIVEFQDDVLADLRRLIQSTEIDDYITINSATSNFVDACTDDFQHSASSNYCAVVATVINATVTKDRDIVLVKTAFFDELALLIADYESQNDLQISFLGPNPLSAEVVFTLGGLPLPTPTSEMSAADVKTFEDAVSLVLQESFASGDFSLELTGVSVLSQTSVDSTGRSNRCNPNLDGRRRDLQANCRRYLQGEEDNLRVRTYVTAFHTPPPEMESSSTFPTYLETTMSDNTPFFLNTLQEEKPPLQQPGAEPGPSQQPPPPASPSFFANVQIVAIQATTDADDAVEQPPVLQSPADPSQAADELEGDSSIPLWSILTFGGCLFVLILAVAYVVVKKKGGKGED